MRSTLLQGHTSIRSTAGGESIWLVRHLIDLDLGPGWIVSFHAPALGTHISCTEKVDCAITLTHNYSTVDIVVEGDSCVYANVQLCLGIALLLVKVAALGGFANTIEAVDLHIRRERESSLEWVQPCTWILFVGLDLTGGMRHPVRVAAQHLVLIPIFTLVEEVLQTL